GGKNDHVVDQLGLTYCRKDGLVGVLPAPATLPCFRGLLAQHHPLTNRTRGNRLPANPNPPLSYGRALLRLAIAQRTAISCDRDRPGEDPVCQWPPFPRGCGTTMSSSPSSRRRTTPCFVCIESDGIVGNFNARQQTSHARTLRNRRESQRFSAGYVGPNCVWRAREAESIGKRSGIDRERRLRWCRP